MFIRDSYKTVSDNTFVIISPDDKLLNIIHIFEYELILDWLVVNWFWFFSTFLLILFTFSAIFFVIMFVVIYNHCLLNNTALVFSRYRYI